MLKVFIVGASGLVGSHCLKLLQETRCNAVGTHLNYETSSTIYFNPLTETGKVSLINFKPNVVINCAALTNVDYCEDHISESYEQTVSSTYEIVKYCKQHGVKLVQLSTDYVFDGVQGPYTENSNLNPINVYGKHKLEAEFIVKELEDYLICRITNVYGEEERNKNFVGRLIEILRQNKETTMSLPTDQFATPVYAGDLAKMIYYLLKDRKSGIYNLSSTDYYTRYTLALKVKSFYPLNSKLVISPITTDTLQQKALRPLNAGLLNNKFLKEYPLFSFTNIDKYLSNIIKNGV